jgi:hypothetical protein
MMMSSGFTRRRCYISSKVFWVFCGGCDSFFEMDSGALASASSDARKLYLLLKQQRLTNDI